MEWIYKYFSFTVIIGGFIGGLGFLIKYLIQRKIDSYFNKRLEDHKQELAVMTERSKYDISKKLFDFEAYAAKKHTIYPELYQRMFESWTKVNRISFQIQNPNTFDFDELEKHGIYKRNDEISEFARLLHDAMKYYKTNELFLSKDVSACCWGVITAMRELSEKFDKNDYNSDFMMGEDKIKLAMRVLKEIMHKELSYSHFEENEVDGTP
ncbi:hypothetical protein ACJEBK_27245 [Peribacillus frigoritolerans]|uniref:hypothetical protein n=1 Tax=Peribacillus frigoritolerans TaxID=450367 RepID=UPI003871FFD7